MLTQRAVVLAKLETTPGVDASPTPAADGILVESPTFAPNFKLIQRNFVRPTLSPLPHLIGMKLGSLQFRMEIKGNLLHSGNLGDMSLLGRLFQACGFQATALNSAATCTGQIIPDDNNQELTPLPPVTTWVVGGTSPNVTQPVIFTITVADATHATITNNNQGQAGPTQTAQPLASGTALTLGTTGVTVTPTFAGSQTVGSVYRVWVTPPGIGLAPLTEATQTITLYAYFDGILHKLVGCMGEVSIDAQAGNLPMATFNFGGKYEPVTDTALPTGFAYPEGSILPSQVQLANFSWGSNDSLRVDSFRFTLNNQIDARTDMNQSDGYGGWKIVGRAPDIAIDPESVTEATQPFWADFSADVKHMVCMGIGTVAGNQVYVLAPQAETKTIGYNDRTGTRVYDVNASLVGVLGDDEVLIVLC